MNKTTKEQLKKQGLVLEPMKIYSEVQLKAKAFDYLKSNLDYLINDKKRTMNEVREEYTHTAIIVFDLIDEIFKE